MRSHTSKPIKDDLKERSKNNEKTRKLKNKENLK